jgi:dienelactone hydrolase
MRVPDPDPLRSADEIAAFLRVAVPGPRPIEVDTVGVEDRRGYRLRTVRYRGDEGDDIPALRLEPTEPIGVGVVLFHQHNRERHLGKSEPVGLAGDRLQAFGPVLASAGVTVLAPDALSFEDRRRHASGTVPHPEDDLRHYNELAYRLLDGDTLARKVLQDAVTAVTVLEQAEGLAAVGALGHSFGGHTTLFLSAIDHRIAFACVSGAAGSYRARMASDIGIGFDQVVPGLARRLDFGTLAACVAPRPLLLVAGEDDRHAVDAVDIAEEARTTYRAHDAADLLECEVFPGGHALTEARHRSIVDWVTRRCRAAAPTT